MLNLRFNFWNSRTMSSRRAAVLENVWTRASREELMGARAARVRATNSTRAYCPSSLSSAC